MTMENLKVPLEDSFFRDVRRRNKNKSLITIAFCLLTLLSVVGFVLAIYNFARLKQLENDLREKTEKFANILEDGLYESIDKFENEENFDEETDESSSTDKNYDYAYDDYGSLQEINIKPDEDNEIKPLLLGGDFTKDGELRMKRNVVAATQDGVLINSESYADVKKKNNSLRRMPEPLHITPIAAQPSVFGSYVYTSTKAPPPVYSRASRVMEKKDKTQPRQGIHTSMLKTSDGSVEEYNSEGAFIVREDYPRRRYRNRPLHLESFDESRVAPRMGRIKPLPTIRFDGDTSKYVLGQHVNFNGNGHMRHPRQTYVDWKAPNWVKSADMEQHFNLNNNGELTIKESGLYFIYAQIYYLDEHDTNGFRVYKNDLDIILQCTTSTHTQERTLKGNTCYTAGAEYLGENDVITLSDLSDGRYSLFEPGKSFFGLIKLGDLKIK